LHGDEDAGEARSSQPPSNGLIVTKQHLPNGIRSPGSKFDT